MPDPHVQTQWAETPNQSSLDLSVTLTLGAGNGVLLGFQGGSSLAGFGGISQTDGDALTPILTHNNSAILQILYLAESVSGGSTLFKFAWGNPQGAGMFVMELAGLMGSPFDQSAIQNAIFDTSTPSGTTPALSQASEIAIATWNLDGSGTTNFEGLENGFTIPTNGNQMLGGGHTGIKALTCYKVVSSTDPVETMMHTDGCVSTATIVTLKLASAGGGKPAGYYARQRGA